MRRLYRSALVANMKKETRGAKQTNDYDIIKIEKAYNSMRVKSWAKVSELLGYKKSSLLHHIRTNYDEIVKFVRKERK
jgi:hypothetical protein